MCLEGVAAPVLLPEVGTGVEEAESSCALPPAHLGDVADSDFLGSFRKPGPNPNLGAQTQQHQVGQSPVGFVSPPAPWATIEEAEGH